MKLLEIKISIICKEEISDEDEAGIVRGITEATEALVSTTNLLYNPGVVPGKERFFYTVQTQRPKK